MGRLLSYLEKESMVASGKVSMPPWEDVSLQPLREGAPPMDIVGEHLRVFVNECTWTWAQAKKMEYEAAKAARGEDEHAAEFANLCNESTFTDALKARGVVATEGVQWECAADRGSFSPYEASVNAVIERARQQGLSQVEIRQGPKSWKYVIDIRRFVQINPQTKKERPIRMGRAKEKPPGKGQVSLKDLEEAVRFFVSMDTLAPVPHVD
mmetsp:Transcript_80720/g.261639  ORF Transcript_80720/g.261639 Transcript_80720/m.261639 type:complete len:210 (-) Transcript_80720:49-678(-)